MMMTTEPFLQHRQTTV